MAVRLILKNSSVEDKRPTSSQLDQGEISLNTNAAGPFLCCEDSEGNIQQIGGVKISDDAPGTPVRGTFWLNTVNEKFYIFDGQNWRAVAGSGGGGGGGGGIDTVIGGDGIDASQLGEIVTIDNDIDRNRGLEFVAGRTAVALGSGLSFDADGKVKAESTAMTYKGTVDLTSASVPGTPDIGDSYANIGSGDFSAEWIAATGETDPTTANPGDLVIWNGTKWTYVPTGSGGGGGALPTDLSIGAHDANELEIDSSTGNDVVLPLVDEAADKCGLMSPDDKTKLDTVEAGAQANVNADWDADSGDAEILNKPAIPAAQVNSDWDATSGVAEILNKPDLGVTQITAGTNIAIDPVAGTGNVTINVDGIDVGVTEIVAGDNVTIDPADGLGAVTVNADVGEAPNDGKQYARQSEAWSEVIGGGSGGVNQIVAGDNITIDPSNGLGTVTINSTGGGSGAGVTSIIAGDGISVDQATGDVTITNTGGGGGGGGGTTKADIYGTAKASGDIADDGTIKESFNIASVTRSATGTYDVVFTTPMKTNDYAITLSPNQLSTATISAASKTTAGFQVYNARDSGGGTRDNVDFSFAIFDDQPAEIIVGSGTVANTNLYGTAKLWGTVNATGGVTSGSGGYTVVQNSPGNYSLTFNTPQPSAAYTVVAESDYQPNSLVTAVTISNKTTNGFNVFTNSNSDGGSNSTDWNFSLFNDTPAEVALTTFGDVINYSGAAAWGSVTKEGVLEAGLNIASVTKNGEGNYNVEFITPMPDSLYAFAGSGSIVNTTCVQGYDKTPTGLKVNVNNSSGAQGDYPFTFQIVATNALPPKGGTGTDAWASTERTANNGPCVIESSFNIASVTRTSVGVLTYVFTTPMPNKDYAVQVSINNQGTTAAYLGVGTVYNKTTTGFQVETRAYTDNSLGDRAVDVAVNATNAKLPNSFSEEQIQTVVDLAQSGATNPGASAWGSVAADGTLENGLNCTTSLSGTTYTVSFKAPMPNANYAVTFGGDLYPYINPGSKTANGFSYLMTDGNTSGFTSPSSFAVFATNALPLKGGTGTDSWGSVLEDGTLESSFNVASVTNTGAGLYEVVFTTPMPTATYAVTLGGVTLSQFSGQVELRSTTGFKVVTRNAAQSTKTNRGFSFAVNATNATLPSTISQEELDKILDTIDGGGVAQKVAILADVKPNGTSGGTSVVGWQDRTLNTIQSDTGNLVTLANDKEFTLKAGTYLIEWSAPGYFISRHQTKLTNVTAGSTEQMGSSEFSFANGAGGNACGQSRSFGSARVNITSDTTYKIEHSCESANVDYALGVDNNTGEDEVYTQVTITDLAVLAAGGGGDITYNGAVAWGDVAADGTLEAGLNIASVTKTGTGEYTYVFASPLPSDKYSVVASVNEKSHVACCTTNQTATGFVITVFGGAQVDKAHSFTVDALNALPPMKGGTGTDSWATCQADGTIDASFNVASITRTGLGVYDVVFTTPMPTSKYSVVGSVSYPSKTSGGFALLGDKRVDGFTAQTVSGLEQAFDYPFNFSVNATNAKLPNSFSEEEIQSVVDLAQSGATNPGASAWGKIASNGTLNGGLNVASVTRTGEGKYEVVFITPMPDSNYSIATGTSRTDTSTAGALIEAQSATGFTIRAFNNTSGAAFDRACYFTVFATNSLPLKGGTGTDAWGACAVGGALEGSFNIASVTKVSTGQFDVVFTTPMPTSNYSVQGTVGYNGPSGGACNVLGDKRTDGFRLQTSSSANTYSDAYSFQFTVNATNATLPSTITQEDADLIIDTIKGGGVAQKVAILADVKPSGDPGGSSVVGWQDRTLNTIQSDTGNLVTLANDKEFTLKAGTYLIEWSAPAYKTKNHLSRLTNVTTGVVESSSCSAYTSGGDAVTTRSLGTVRVNISSATTYKIEQYCQDATAGNGLGDKSLSASGEDSIFTQVTITDLAVLSAGGSGGGSATVGEIVAWANSTVPTGWLECDGSPIPTQYSSLIALVGANTPDLRGEFVRGWDNGAGVDAGRALLSNQDDEFETHRHLFAFKAGGDTGTTAAVGALTRSNDAAGAPATEAAGSTETRPRNVALMYIINADGSGGGSGGGGSGGGDITYNGASAWGDVAGDGTLNNGLNIASVTRTTTGTYSVVFTTPMPTINYSITSSSQSTSISNYRSKTVNGFELTTVGVGGSSADSDFSFAVQSANALPPKGGTGTDAWATVDETAVNGACNVPGSFNIKSITRTGTGQYEVVFTTPMPTTNYSIAASILSDTAGFYSSAIGSSKLTTGFTMRTGFFDGSNKAYDYPFAFNVNASSTVTPTYTWTREGTTLKPANDGDLIEAGEVITSKAGTGTVKLTGSSSIYAQQIVDINDVRKIGFKWNGDITANNVTFNLDADNVANFSADGEYTGPTLDVKALLLTLQTAAARIETLEAKVQTLEGGSDEVKPRVRKKK